MASPIWNELMRQLNGDGGGVWRRVSLERNPFEDTIPGGFNSGTPRREPITNDSATDDVVSEPVGTPTRIQRSGGSGDDRLSGTDGNDLLSGGDGNDSLDGQFGDDWLQGGDGNDSLDGQHGDDWLQGGAGNDFMIGGKGDDFAEGGAGNDWFHGQAGSDTFAGGAGADYFDGGADKDTASYADSTTGVHINLALGRGYTGDAAGDRFLDVENVIGSQGDDIIVVGTHDAASFNAAEYLTVNPDVKAYIEANKLGESWANTHWLNWGRFEGRAGGWAGFEYAPGEDTGTNFVHFNYVTANPDVLKHIMDNNLPLDWARTHWDTWGQQEGRTGALIASGSVIAAGAGDDEVQGGVYSDYLTGEAGNDVLRGHAGDDALFGGAGNDSLRADGGQDQLYGGTGDDFLEGASGNDTVDGGDGHDRVYGNKGDDLVRGGAGNDRMDGGELDGRDTLEGGDGDDFLWGRDGDDVLRGDAGNDLLDGGAGADVLNGGSGNDNLWGGAGDDRFVFDANGGQDVVKDFGGGDVLRLEGVTSSHRDFWGSHNKPVDQGYWTVWGFVVTGTKLTTDDGRSILIEGISGSQLKGGVVDGGWEWHL